MTVVYNAKPASLDIEITKGDIFSKTFSVAVNDIAYDLTGSVIDIIIKNKLGVATKTLASDGATPAITIYANTYTILTSAFTVAGIYKYDVQLTEGTLITTFQKGNVLVTDEITT